MPAQMKDDDLEGEPSYNSDKNEYVLIKLSDIRKELQCPICLGIIRKTRTVMECLHRFCRECIDKAMRLGNNECPACRTHCASRRSLRDDPKYDALIAAIYPDLDKYEEEEFTLHEEDKYRNKQIQASIAQTLQRQLEAVASRRTTAKATAEVIVRKAHGKFQNVQNQNISNRGESRRKRQRNDTPTADEENTILEHSSSGEEESQEYMKIKRKRRVSRSLCETSANVDNSSEGHDEVDHCPEEVSRENTFASNGRGSTEGLVWGKNGARSHMRYGSINGSNGKHARGTRIVKMVDYLLSKAHEEDEIEFDIQVTLLPFNNDANLISLESPYLCCRPTVSVKHLCKLLALKLSIPAEDLEIVMERKRNLTEMELETKLPRLSMLGKGKSILDASENKEVIEVLDQEATLTNIFDCIGCRGSLVLMYRRRLE